MENTTLSISPHLSPPPSTTNLRRDVQHHAQSSMPLTDLTALRRITAETPFRFRSKTLKNHIITPTCPKFMSDEPKKTDNQPRNYDSTTASSDVEKSGDEKQSGPEPPQPAPVPPPPEKPLPGDCCGSGCVRCVWDVYYEELEEYNKLYKAN